MKHVKFISFLLLFSVWLIGPVGAQDPIFYPAKEQSDDQLEKDNFECYNWAKKRTGFDPMKTPTTKTAAPEKEEKVWGTGETAVVGGVVGAGVGAIAGGGKGALIGGAVGVGGGALIGGARSSDQREREEKKRKNWEKKESNRYARERNEYNRALGACMEGRGYSVK